MATDPPSQADREAILRVASYHRKDLDMVVVWFPPRTHATVESSLKTIKHEPQHSLGDLDKIPLELTSAICLKLDLASLFAFRQVNRRAQEVLVAIPEYKVVTTHALGALCAIFRSKTAVNGSLLDLYRLMCTQTCSVCGQNYGDFMSLIDWTRCCLSCVRSQNTKTRLTSAWAAKKLFIYPKGTFSAGGSFSRLVKIQSIPGIYGLCGMRYHLHRRTSLVSYQALLSIQSEDINEVLKRLPGPDFTPAMRGYTALPHYAPKTKRFQNGVACAGCYLAVIGTGHRQSTAQLSMFYATYSEQQFLEHFQLCHHARGLWISSELGDPRPYRLTRYLDSINHWATHR